MGSKKWAWRKKEGITQDSLAKKADIPYTTIAKIESDLKNIFIADENKDSRRVRGHFR